MTHCILVEVKKNLARATTTDSLPTHALMKAIQVHITL